MIKNVLLVLSIIFLVSCSGQSQADKKEAPLEEAKEEEVNKDVKNLNFDEIFKNISPEEITDNVFKLFGKDYAVITSGNKEHYNSMTAAFGGFGQLFSKPATWCFLRSNRYTLEVIRKEHTYTMCYFDDEYDEEVLFFGSKSGRSTEKMKESKLTMVQTPSGAICYKEARLVVECKLMEVTTVNPDDFYTQEGKDFVNDAYKETKDYHKLVFGEITNVWVNK